MGKNYTTPGALTEETLIFAGHPSCFHSRLAQKYELCLPKLFYSKLEYLYLQTQTIKELSLSTELEKSKLKKQKPCESINSLILR